MREAHNEVFVDATGEGRDALVAVQGNEVIADPLEEVPVMRDHQESAGKAVKEILKCGESLDVEVVRRFVEDEDVRAAHEQAGELEPAALAA